MKTMLSALAATAVLTASAHAGAVPQQVDRAGVPIPQAAPAPGAAALDGDTLAEIVFAIPAGFKGFHGVDLAAASLAGGNSPGPAPVGTDGGPYPRVPYPVREHAYLLAPARLAGDEAPDGDGLPEPTTLAILSVGLAGLVVSSRKKA